MGPSIVVTTSSGISEDRLYLNRSYVRAIHQWGGMAYLLPIEEANRAPLYLEMAQGLLLSGGGDIDPAFYGQKPHPALGPVDAARDRWEIALARVALARKLPLLAICRGLQILNVGLGGTLIQDIPSQVRGALGHQSQMPRSALVHRVTLGAGSRLARIFKGTRLKVNSFHHQAVDYIAPGLKVTGWAPDGVVEGVEGTDSSFLVGVQWHPENLTDGQGGMAPLFQAFIAAAGKYGKS